jgi:hypothetical protein
VTARLADDLARSRGEIDSEHSSRISVRQKIGLNQAVPRRLSRTRWRFDSRGLPVKYAFGSRRSMAWARGASAASSVRPVSVSYQHQARRT